MHRICFAAILLAATLAGEARADMVPVTVSGTETFYFAPQDDYSLAFESGPPYTITGTGTFYIEPDSPYHDSYLDLDTNVAVQGLFGEQFFDLTDGMLHTCCYPEVSIAFHYDPNGLSSGTFYFQSTSLDGYVGDGVYVPGRNYITASGTITQTAVTPEPSSFALLGTGLLGVAGVLKRRFAGQDTA